MDVSDKPRVAVIDYGMGNMFSVKRACEHAGLEPLIANTGNMIMSSDAAILPGVGAFGDAISNLRVMDLIEPIRDFIASGRPFMGVCLGMQLLMSESEEFGRQHGLDIIKGSVSKFSHTGNGGNRVKVPQVGWNRILTYHSKVRSGWDVSPLKDVKIGEYMYFVHSFYVIPHEDEAILSTTDYEGINYCSSILQNNIFACQFHPEKSGNEGLAIYRAWASQVNGVKEISA